MEIPEKLLDGTPFLYLLAGSGSGSGFGRPYSVLLSGRPRMADRFDGMTGDCAHVY